MEGIIEIKDYNKELHELKAALNLVGFQFTYKEVDLLWRAMEMYEIKESAFSVKDAVEIQLEWSNHWHNYFENKYKHKTKKDKNGRYNNNHTAR